MIIDKNDKGWKILFFLMVYNIIGMMNLNCIVFIFVIVDFDVKVLNRMMKRFIDFSVVDKVI